MEGRHPRIRATLVLLLWGWFLFVHVLYVVKALRVTAERVPGLAWLQALLS